MWWDSPTVDGAVKHLTKALNQLTAVINHRERERVALINATNHNQFELDRARRIHTKLDDLIK